MSIRRFGGRWQIAAELLVIGLWAAWVGRTYLDLNPYTWPVAHEWGTQLQTHQLWPQLLRCGGCAFWNGGINGGAPAFADLFGSMLHPLVMVTTLTWGVVAGAKVAVVISLGLGGLAQWWIARVLQVGTVARLWSALLAVVGGHLAGRMENGNFGLVLSTAACSLAVAAAFDLGMRRERRATLLLAVTGGLALLSGQAYLQIALFAWTPAYLWLVWDGRRWSPVWREYLLAGGLAMLLASVLLVPLVHFWPHVTKETDVTFQAAQPLRYIPLNLVLVPDGTPSTAWARLPYPYLYDLYIGWLPVVLAVLALVSLRRGKRRPVLFLASGVLLTFWFASGDPFRLVRGSFPFVANVRHTPLIAGLALPGILGLSAIGLDGLYQQPWLARSYRLAYGRVRTGHDVHPVWLVSLPLLWSLVTPATLTQMWLRTSDMQPLYAAIGALRTPGPEWVAPPFGDLLWTQAGLDLGLKLSPIVWVYRWHGVAMPYLEALPDGAAPALVRVGPWADLPLLNRNDLSGLPGGHMERSGTLIDVPIYRYPEQQYAAVTTSMGLQPCTASGSGGVLAVICTTAQAGELTVQEHLWSGWSATCDGVPVPLISGDWLRLQAPAGTHRYVFRYQPWDVPVGLALTLLGGCLTFWLALRIRRRSSADR